MRFDVRAGSVIPTMRGGNIRVLGVAHGSISVPGANGSRDLDVGSVGHNIGNREWIRVLGSDGITAKVEVHSLLKVRGLDALAF